MKADSVYNQVVFLYFFVFSFSIRDTFSTGLK